MFIIKINVEGGGRDIYYRGPFNSGAEAEQYVELYHGELDAVEVIEVIEL